MLMLFCLVWLLMYDWFEVDVEMCYFEVVMINVVCCEFVLVLLVLELWFEDIVLMVMWMDLGLLIV